MLRLKVLGGVAVLRDGEKPGGAATQRRRLALLAVIAAAGNRGVSRDRLLTLLWPDSDEQKGRHGLAQSLYALKRDLGADSLFLGTSELRLDPATITSDIQDFRDAIAAGDLPGAVSLYQGPLLDGVYVSGAPDFERWVDSERQSLATSFSAACESLAEQQRANGDVRGASATLSRLAAIDPLNKRIVVKAMRSLAESGDVSGALDHAARHESHRREDLEMPADVEVISLRDDIAASQHHAARPEVKPRADITSIEENSEPASISVEPAAAMPRSSFRRRVNVYWLATAAALGLVGSVIARQATSAGTTKAENRIAVLPFIVRGNPRLAYLGDGIVDLLSHRLDGAGAIHTVDPNALLEFVRTDSETSSELLLGRSTARRFGAGQFIVGSIVDAGGKIQISATIYDAEGNRLAVADASASDEEHILSLVDDIARGLVGMELSQSDTRLGREAALTTASLPALKAFLQGEEEFRAAHMQTAVDSYLSAVTADSTFALAWYRLSTAADWASQSDVVSRATRAAVRFEDRLSAEEKTLLDARMASLRGDDDKVESLYGSILASHPEDGEAWMQLGETIFHNGGWRGKPIQESRAAFERAAQLRSSHVASLLHLARLAALRNDRTALDTLIPPAILSSRDASQTLELSALDALTATGTERSQKFLDSLGNLPANAQTPEAIRVTAWRLATFTSRPDASRQLALLLTKPGNTSPTRLSGFLTAAHMSAAMGNWAQAKTFLDAAELIDRASSIRTRANIASSGFFPVAAGELREIRDRMASLAKIRDNSVTTLADVSLVGRLSAALNDSASVRQSLQNIAASTRDDSSLSLIGTHLREQVIARQKYFAGNKSDGLAAVETGWPSRNPQSAYPLLQSEAYTMASGRFLRARLLDEAGRYAEALPWYETIAEDQGYGTMYLAPSYLRRAVIEERLGRTAAAIDHYKRFVSLWRTADASLQPQVSFARSRLSRLSQKT